MQLRAHALATMMLAGVALVVACRDATEVLVEARTDVPSKPLIVTAFTLGAPGETEDADSTTETRAVWGPDGVIGTIGVVPSGDDDGTLSVKIVMGVKRDPRGCSIASPNGCIFARRKLRYSPHELLRLPIFLYSRCEDIPCDPNSTCNYLGQCVPSDVDPGTCSSAAGCTIPGEPDPTKPPLDASLPTDATNDTSAQNDASATDGQINDGSLADADGNVPRTDSSKGTTVLCGSKTCVDQACCLTATMTRSCADTCGLNDFAITCDDALDCPGAEKCCVENKGTQCVAACSPTAREVCGASGVCKGAGTSCTGTSNGIMTCQ